MNDTGPGHKPLSEGYWPMTGGVAYLIPCQNSIRGLAYNNVKYRGVSHYLAKRFYRPRVQSYEERRS